MHRQFMDTKIHNFSVRGTGLPQVTLRQGGINVNVFTLIFSHLFRTILVSYARLTSLDFVFVLSILYNTAKYLDSIHVFFSVAVVYFLFSSHYVVPLWL